jgi:hypothetical protein
MTAEQFRAKVLNGMDAALSHPFLSGLTTEGRHIVESTKLFFTSEVTAEQLQAMAARVSD